MNALFVIVDREITEIYINIINHFKPKYQVVTLGRGTANSEILNYFGLAKKDKSVILSIVENEDKADLLEELKKETNLHSHGGGVAFTVPLSSMNKKFLELIKEIANIKLEDKHESI